MVQEDLVSETAQMSWGDFKPRLADAASYLQHHMAGG